MPRTPRPRKGSTPKARSTSGAGKGSAPAAKKPRTKRSAAPEALGVTAALPEAAVPTVTASGAPDMGVTAAAVHHPEAPASGLLSVELPSEGLTPTSPVAVVGALQASEEPGATTKGTRADSSHGLDPAPTRAAPGEAAPEAGHSSHAVGARLTATRVPAGSGAVGARAPASVDPRGRADETPEAPPVDVESSPTRTASVELEDGPQYLYGVVRAVGDLDFGLIGLGAPPADVRAVREGNLAALVSTAPAQVVDPTRAHLLVHQRVTEAVLREHTLLPVAFGTVLRSEAEVRSLLRTAQDALAGALAALEGHVELGLKVLYHREHLARRLELEDSRLARQDGEPEADHERRVGIAVEARIEQDMGSLLEGLRPLARTACTWSPVGDRMLLNAAFLVARDAVPAFEAKVKSLAARSDIYAFRFTGPWAPYSFVDIRLGLEPGPDAAA